MNIVLPAFAIILFTYLGWEDYLESKSIGDLKSLKLQKKGIAISVSIILLSLWFVLHLFPQYLGTTFSLAHQRTTVFGVSVLFSFIISLSWYLYLSWLDIYEKEQAGTLIITFVMACGSTFLAFPIGDFIEPFTFQLNGTFWNDLSYCIVNIGMKEELVKILPFLIVLKLTRAVNESYDYLLYGGVCALGFAFIENVLYLDSSNLYSLNGRSMYSTVSHMFDTGIICYHLAMAKYRGTNSFVAFIKGFLLASLAHGFYDFWLISEGYSYPLITIGFFLMSIHIFTYMKNNLINISEFYDEGKRVDANRNKYRLFNLLLFIMFGGFVFVYMINGTEVAIGFIKNSLQFNMYVLVYLAVSFGSINVINGYVAPFRISKRFFLPLVNRHPNYLGIRFILRDTPRGRRGDESAVLTDYLPVSGTFTKRVVVDGDFTWYFFVPDDLNEAFVQLGAQMIIRPVRFTRNLRDGSDHLVHIGFVKNQEDLDQVEFTKDQCNMIGYMLLKSEQQPAIIPA